LLNFSSTTSYTRNSRGARACFLLKAEFKYKKHKTSGTVSGRRMSNIDKSGILRLIFGIFVLVFGIILLFYEQVDTYNLNGIPFSVSRGYPYQYVSIPLILVGIIFAIIGGCRWKMRQRKETITFLENFVKS
jgi:hypothetical protein